MPRGSVSRGVCVQRVCVQGDLCPRVLCPGGLCPGGVSVQGMSLSRGISVKETPIWLHAGGTHPTGMQFCYYLKLHEVQGQS